MSKKRSSSDVWLVAGAAFIAGAATTAMLSWQFEGSEPAISPTELVPAATSRASGGGAAPDIRSSPPAAPPAETTSPVGDLSARVREDDGGGDAHSALRGRALTLPVAGIKPTELRDTFDEVRGAGRKHEAIDILAPRNTPVLAVEDGRVAKLFLSKPGGITIYLFDPSERFAYYYAHLERYANGLAEGDVVKRGDVIGYVGTSGNAPKDTPHLHFAIFELTPEKRWWQGTAIDPFRVFRQEGGDAAW